MIPNFTSLWYRLWSDEWLQQGSDHNNTLGKYAIQYVSFVKFFKEIPRRYGATIQWNANGNGWYTDTFNVIAGALTDVTGTLGDVTNVGFYIQQWSNHKWWAEGY